MLDAIQVTRDKYKYQGIVQSRQLEWLKQDLSGLSKNTPIVIVTHIPLLTLFTVPARALHFLFRPTGLL